MNFLKKLIFSPAIYFSTESTQPIKNVGEDRVGPGHANNSNYNDNSSTITSENTNSETTGNSIYLEECDRKSIFQKSKKVLTTCKTCGHYRFAKRNTKRIINPAYPYEHSAKGGCNIPPHRYVPPGQKLRRICVCEYCVAASTVFDHNPVQNKKQRQYLYNRTPDQEAVWSQLKTRGWYCRKGKYFCPGMKYSKFDGLSQEQVF